MMPQQQTTLPVKTLFTHKLHITMNRHNLLYSTSKISLTLFQFYVLVSGKRCFRISLDQVYYGICHGAVVQKASSPSSCQREGTRVPAPGRTEEQKCSYTFFLHSLSVC